MNRCPNCMKIIDNKQKCPHCNHDLSLMIPEHYLSPGSILNDRYVIGRVIGQGGFGITYVGWDQKLEIRVAIKEYYPKGYVSRMTAISPQVTKIVGEDHRIIDLGKERFLKEARILAQLRDTPGVVNVQDFFEENQTAYIVMEFLSGITLQKRLESGSYATETVFHMMLPIMNVVQKIHEQGLIHRDISPDNIILMDDGSLKLLDFGAAKDISQSLKETRTIAVAKSGYSPPEQYLAHNNLSPASDIYSIFATIYKCITGITPEDSLERTWDDQMKWPKELGIPISNKKSDAIQRGMQIKAEERFQSLKEVKAFLQEDDSLEIITEQENQRQNKVSVHGVELSSRIFKFACVILFMAAIFWGYSVFFLQQDLPVDDVSNDANQVSQNNPGFLNVNGEDAITVASYEIDGDSFSVRSKLKDYLDKGWEPCEYEYYDFKLFPVETILAQNDPMYHMKPYEKVSFLLLKGNSKIVIVTENDDKKYREAKDCLVTSIYLYGCYQLGSNDEYLMCSADSCIVNGLDIYKSGSQIGNLLNASNSSINERISLYVIPIAGEESTVVKHISPENTYEKTLETNCFKIIYNLENKNLPVLNIEIPTKDSYYKIDRENPLLETLMIDGETYYQSISVKSLKQNGWKILGDPNDLDWTLEQRDFVRPLENKTLIMEKSDSLIEVYLANDYDKNTAIDKCMITGILFTSADGTYHVNSLRINGEEYDDLLGDSYSSIVFSTSMDDFYVDEEGYNCYSVSLCLSEGNIYLEFDGIGDIVNYISNGTEYEETNESISTISIDGIEYNFIGDFDVFIKDGWSVRDSERKGRDKNMIDAFHLEDSKYYQVMEKDGKKVLFSSYEDINFHLLFDMKESKVESLKLNGVEINHASISKLYDYFNKTLNPDDLEEKGSIAFGFQNGYLETDYDDSGEILRAEINYYVPDI